MREVTLSVPTNLAWDTRFACRGAHGRKTPSRDLPSAVDSPALDSVMLRPSPLGSITPRGALHGRARSCFPTVFAAVCYDAIAPVPASPLGAA